MLESANSRDLLAYNCSARRTILVLVVHVSTGSFLWPIAAFIMNMSSPDYAERLHGDSWTTTCRKLYHRQAEVAAAANGKLQVLERVLSEIGATEVQMNWGSKGTYFRGWLLTCSCLQRGSSRFRPATRLRSDRVEGSGRTCFVRRPTGS